jgi:SAM-dependent methyltransferase
MAVLSFVVEPEAYARFMGRYAEPLAEVFVAFAGVGEGDRVLDVGCGPGALTAHLLSIGAEVAAIDPSPPFIDAIRARFPDIDARRGTAEELPYDTASFDAALRFRSGPCGWCRRRRPATSDPVAGRTVLPVPFSGRRRGWPRVPSRRQTWLRG